MMYENVRSDLYECVECRSSRYDLSIDAKCLNILDQCECCKALFYQQSDY
jgi:hypothetical protein